MNIFRRERPVWENPKDSVGTEIPDLSIKGAKVYEATGLAYDAFIELQPDLRRLLEVNKEDIERGEAKPRAVGVGLYMIGTEPCLAVPTIIISSLSKKQRRMIKALLKKENTLCRYPAIRIETLSELPAVLTALTTTNPSRIAMTVEAGLKSQFKRDIKVLGTPSNISSAVVRFGHRSASMGIISVTINAESERYGITAKHLGWLEAEADGDVFNLSGGTELAFDSDSEDEIDDSEEYVTSTGILFVLLPSYHSLIPFDRECVYAERAQ